MEDDIELATGTPPLGEFREGAVDAEAVEVSDKVAWGFTVDRDTPASEALINWYANLPSQRLDLVGELGDSRGVFVVHGESLIAHVLANHCQNFAEDKLFVNAIYFVERYLDIFMQAKNGKNGIRVVFLDALRFKFQTCESEALLRELVVLHLTSTLGTEVVKCFPDWLCEDFSNFVSSTDISSFILCDEGSLVTGEGDDDDEGELLVQYMYLALCLHVVTAHRVRIAFLDQLEQRGNRIVAMSIGPERRHEAVQAKVVGALRPVFDELREDSADAESCPEKRDRISILFAGIRLTLNDIEDLASQEARLVVTILKAVAITALVGSAMSLPDRSHATLSASQWSIFDPEEGYFAQVWSQLATNLAIVVRVAHTVITSNGGVTESSTDSVCDLFDGRLFRTLVYALWKDQSFAGKGSPSSVVGLTTAAAAQLEALWASVDTGAVTGSVFDLSIPVDLPAPESEDFPSPPQPRSSPEFIELAKPLAIIDRATAVAQSMGETGQAVVDRLGDVALVAGPATKPNSLGSYIPETQLVTRRFEDKKKRDYEDQKSKWKHLSIDKLASRMRNWELRGAQKELRAMHQYAKSLVGADSLHHAIALVQDPSTQRRGRQAAPAVAVADAEEAPEPTGPKVSKKAAEIIARNVANQQKTQAGKDSDQIKPLIERAEAIADSRDFSQFETALFDLCAGYSRILDSFDGFKGISSSVKLEASQVKVIVAVIKACRSVLKKLTPSATGHMSTEEARLGLRSACAKVVRLCCSFVAEHASAIEGKDIVRVQELLCSVGFSHTSKNLFGLWKAAQKEEPVEEKKDDKKDKKDKKGKEEKKDKKEKKEDKKTEAADEFYVKSSKVDVLADVTGGDEYLFQLVHLSTELDRPSGTLSDKRVMFKPDYWQRELLDIVDKNESALVCAPTASGKTFICYYAMEKVLRSSNDKVAVYVAPSKALMNQVDAEIYARFRSKTYPATDHFHLNGDLEKDYQHNPFNCQVLVTIPSMLEQLLLDPTMQDWVKRIEYVIFDEVHCMGESADESAIWEHALQLIPCPFLAMSATVGNPSKFHDWLNYVADIKGGPKVHLIEYKERYNDLQKFAYSPDDSALLAIHPFTVFSYEDVLSGVIPPDLTMTPSETALLVSVLRKAVVESAPAERKEEAEEATKRLLPRKVFEKLISVDSMVTKRQFREYEKLLLDEFIKLNESGIVNRGVFERIQTTLSQSPRVGNAKSMNELWSLVSGSSAAKPSTTSTTVNIGTALAETTCHYLDAEWLNQFLVQLDSYSLLPAIIFNLDRAEIMKMAERLGEHLRRGQYDKYYGTEERAYATRAINKKRSDAYEAQLARRRMMERKNKKDEDFDETEIAEGIPLPVMVEDEFDPEFSFAGVRAISDPECHELIDKLAESKKIKPWIIEGLKRGIGMHHEGCSTRLKKTVEVLFRRGFLRVVIATSTLSLGINMPCKSTIFVGTHVKLNALNYRQMAGRAGRRGFDLVGHVIFVDSTQKNIRRLLTSELTQLGGDFALTPSHILRAQIMMDHLGQNGQLTGKIEKHLMAMLMGSFMPFNVNASANSLAVLRSGIDFLIRDGLLTSSGQVTRLGALAAFLFKREPENFIVSRVLLSRDLLAEVERWLQEERADQPTSMATFKLMKVLSAFCFAKPQLRGAARRAIPPRKRNLPTETCPLLPPVESFLPEGLCELSEKFNERSIENVVARLLVYLGSSRGSSAVPTLPASGAEVKPTAGQTLVDASPLTQLLQQQRVTGVQVRSAFSAICGKGDYFESAQELVMSAHQRPDLMLDSASVPSVASGRISSYACDFLLHGKLSLLQNDCLIGVSESWKEIDEWRFFLESLNIALEYMFELDNTHEYAHLQKVVKDLTVELSTKLHLEGA